jgi:spore germination protein KB
MSVFGISGRTAGTGGTISNGQTALIAIGAVLSITVFVLPGPSVMEAGNDGYWSPILATIPSVAQLGLFYWLGKRHGWRSPYEYLPELLGTWLGKLVSLAYAFLFLFVAGSVNQLLTKVLAAVFMPLTPTAVFAVCTALAAAYAAWLGLEAFGRLAQLIMPLMLGAMALVPLALIQQSDFGQILPILHFGWAGPLRGAPVPIAMRGEALLLLGFLLPHMRTPQRGFRVGMLVTCSIAILLAINAISLIAVFSPAEVSRLSMPIVTAARQIRLVRVIEHVESLIIGPWTVALVLKVAIFVYFSAVGVARVAGTGWRPLILALAMLSGAIGSWMYPNAQTLSYTISRIWPGYSLTMILLVPLALAIVSVIKGKPPGRRQQGGGPRMGGDANGGESG